jgi:sulfur-oxidizing protein SoxZ
MSTQRTRIRAKQVDATTTEIFVLVSHPMETGQRVNPKTQEKIPPHFIQKLSFLLNGKEVAVMDTGMAISKDPLVSIRIKKPQRGDKIKVVWSDNLGQKDEETITVGEGS